MNDYGKTNLQHQEISKSLNLGKRIRLLAIMLVLSVLTFGQALDGYKYVYVPALSYQNGGTDIWGIAGRLRNYFSNKGFIVLNELVSPPKEIVENTCLLLSCEINHTNIVVGTNEVTIVLRNCKNEIVISNTGSAAALSVQDDFNKATKRAFSLIESINYRFDPTKTPKIVYPTVEKLNESEETITKYLNTNELDKIEGIYKSYQAEYLPFYKIGIIKRANKFVAVIIEAQQNNIWKEGEIKAYFEPSSMSDFYSVKWYMGNKTPFETFALLENDAILSIEFKNFQTGEKRTDKFIKIYPATESKSSFENIQKSTGSGFFITSSGIIATNAHVVENAKTLKVNLSNEIGSFDYSAKILLKDVKNDVALLQIEDDSFKELSEIPYSFIEKAEVGEKSFTIGYPLNDVMGTNYKVTDGIISSISGIQDDMRYYQISVPLQPGNSGGPLFNSSGDVIGITSARLDSKSVATEIENVNYAIKISYLLNLYNMLPDSDKLRTTPSKPYKELQEQVKILKNYVCLIKVN